MLKVLIVEDDLMLADFAEEILVEHGYEVCGIAPHGRRSGCTRTASRPDLVVLDLRLADGGLGTEVAAQLLSSAGPASSMSPATCPRCALTDGDACLAKPYRSVDLLRGLEIVAGIVATGKALPPFPQGFRLLHPAVGTPRRSGYE